MQAIILAAGEGTRMRPLTWTKAKPLLEVAGKSLLERNLEQLGIAGCDSVVIVVGYKAEQIKQAFGDRYGTIKLSYVLQVEQKGTGHALLQAEGRAEERFIVLMGDDLYSAQDVKVCWNAGLSIAASEVKDPQRFGVLVVNGGRIMDVVEKSAQPSSNLANTGLYCMDKRIFAALRSVKQSQRGEIELTDAVKAMAKAVYIKVVKATGWKPVGYPWDLLAVSEELIKQEVTEQEIDSAAKVSDKATLIGPVRVGAGTVIKAGAYVEGPVIFGENCMVGPNCFIRAGTVIGNNVSIGNAVEIKNSLVGDGTHISHLSYVGDSVIGGQCNLAAGTITANLRHDNRSVRVVVKGQLVDTGRRKFGVVIGDRSKTGIHTSLHPGVLLGPWSWTAAGAIVRENIAPFKLLDGKEQLELEPKKFEALVKEPGEFNVLQELYAKSHGGK
jgi:bifunctional UDP-N-acetylglucosamine pyrophosphorylase/glucosamine-1-phosphate N-acetyltransferase